MDPSRRLLDRKSEIEKSPVEDKRSAHYGRACIYHRIG